MNPTIHAQVVERFEKLLVEYDSIDRKTGIGGGHISTNRPPLPGATPPKATPQYAYTTPNEEQCRTWASKAGAAIADVFPSWHNIRADWNRLIDSWGTKTIGFQLEMLSGVLKAARDLVEDGYVGTLSDKIKAETLVELLEQADWLLNADFISPAACLAGGALETHLRHLAERHGIVLDGYGTIDKYNSEFDRRRKSGPEAYSLADSHSVKRWCNLRNGAAHDPSGFAEKVDKEQVKSMINDIRSFIARVP